MPSYACLDRPYLHGRKREPTRGSEPSHGRRIMSTGSAIDIPGYVVGTLTIDAAHSDVAFKVRHLMVSKVRGHFTRFQGEIVNRRGPAGLSGHRDDRPRLDRHYFIIVSTAPPRPPPNSSPGCSTASHYPTTSPSSCSNGDPSLESPPAPPSRTCSPSAPDMVHHHITRGCRSAPPR